MTILNPVDRRKLAADHMALVHWRIDKCWKRLLTIFTRDELVSFGSEGLVRAANNYDPNCGVKFNTYAVHGIDGRILWGAKRERIRRGRPAGFAIGLGPNKAKGDSGADSTECCGRNITDPSAHDPKERAVLMDIRQAMPEAMACLSRRDRAIATDLLHGMSCRDAAAKHGVSDGTPSNSLRRLVTAMCSILDVPLPDRSHNLKPYREGGVRAMTEDRRSTLAVYNSVGEAAQQNGLSKREIRKVLRGERRMAGGMAWKWN